MSINGNQRQGEQRLLNVLSVDVEDYHNQLSIEYQQRLAPPSREALHATERLLDIFAEYNAKGTFFILGEIAEHFPAVVRRIGAEGHHLGIHGYHHLRVTWQSPKQFRDSIRRAKNLVEDLTGREADAYRAPWFSINESSLWALEILAELGFRYDSSIFPINAKRYGLPSSPLTPYRHPLSKGKGIWEVPMTAIDVAGGRRGACGGGHLRVFPLGYTQYAMRQLKKEERSAIVYLHPYEIVPRPKFEPLPEQSLWQRFNVGFYNFHQCIGRGSVERKVRWLLENHRFGTIEQLIAERQPQAVHEPSEQTTETTAIGAENWLQAEVTGHSR